MKDHGSSRTARCSLGPGALLSRKTCVPPAGASFRLECFQSQCFGWIYPVQASSAHWQRIPTGHNGAYIAMLGARPALGVMATRTRTTTRTSDVEEEAAASEEKKKKRRRAKTKKKKGGEEERGDGAEDSGADKDEPNDGDDDDEEDEDEDLESGIGSSSAAISGSRTLLRSKVNE